jgi:hypothetical protein
MGQFLARFWLKGLLALALVYCTFFVQMGERTFWQHAMRIAGTDEARELGHGIVAALDSAKTAVTQKLGNRLGGSASP